MNDHGWVLLDGSVTLRDEDGRVVAKGVQIHAGRAVDRLTCGCTHAPCGAPCTRVATQEDLLCDECRVTCR